MFLAAHTMDRRFIFLDIRSFTLPVFLQKILYKDETKQVKRRNSKVQKLIKKIERQSSKDEVLGGA